MNINYEVFIELEQEKGFTLSALYHEQVHGEPDESERGQEESQELTEGRQSGEEESLAECQEEEDRGRILSSPSRKRSDSSVISDVSSKVRFEFEKKLIGSWSRSRFFKISDSPPQNFLYIPKGVRMNFLKEIS